MQAEDCTLTLCFVIFLLGLAICQGGIFMAVYPDSRQGIICHYIMLPYEKGGKEGRIKLVMQLRLLLIWCNWEEMKINEGEGGRGNQYGRQYSCAFGQT